MNKQIFIDSFKAGKTIKEIAKENHINAATVSDVIKSQHLPTNKIIAKILADPTFKTTFTKIYNSSDSMKEIVEQMSKLLFFSSIRKTSLDRRIGEIRSYFDLPPKLQETSYDSKYDRIRGYIIRNSKFCAKRRGIPFNLTYKDFELPEYCPILGIKLEYRQDGDGNSPQHATLDRIDNSKGYEKNNVMVISRLANQMKSSASFEQIKLFIKHYSYMLNYIDKQGTLGSITDMFPHWKKLSLDS